MPWFNVDDGFANSKPVLRIPRRYRCAAIGLWTLAGSWSAKELTDGFVPDHTIEEFASTPAIADVLVKCGLWKKSGDGWQFENWPKWQKTKAQVLAFREAEAERKRNARAKNKPKDHPTNGLGETYSDRDRIVNGSSTSRAGESGSEHVADCTPKTAGTEGVSTPDAARTKPGVPLGHHPESGQPLPKPSPSPKETSSAVSTEPHSAPEPTPAASATPGADLVRENIRGNHPSATLTALRIQASELLKTGTDRDTVASALQLWNDKPSVGIGRTILASLCSEVIKTANGAPATGSKPSKLRKTVSLANRVRAQENAQLATSTRLELE